MITLKIDVSKIDKNRLFKGKKGTYLDLVLIDTPNSQYADYMVKQSVSKEEREQGVDIILGDGKIWTGNSNLDKAEAEARSEEDPGTVDDDLPF